MVKTIETTHDKGDIIIQLLNAQKARQFREEYLDLHVYEQAQIFTDLTEKQRARLYRYLTAEEVGDMFDAIEEEPEEVVNYFKEMTPQYAANVIDQMYTDNAVDILAYAQKKDLAKYLRLIPKKRPQKSEKCFTMKIRLLVPSCRPNLSKSSAIKRSVLQCT